MVASYGFLTAMGWQRPLSMPAWGPLSPLRLYHCLGVIYAIVQIGDGGLYWDFKVRVLFEKASLFNARGLCNPGKVRRRVFELTSRTY